MSAILLVGICFIALMYGLQALSSFRDSTIGDCEEGVRMAYNDTTVTDNGSVGIVLPSFIPGAGILNVTYTGSGIINAGGCSYSAASPITVPRSCMKNPIIISYTDMNVSNTSIEYVSLENCDFLSDEYHAMKTNANAINTVFTASSYILYAVISIILILILVGLFKY